MRTGHRPPCQYRIRGHLTLPFKTRHDVAALSRLLVVSGVCLAVSLAAGFPAVAQRQSRMGQGNRGMNQGSGGMLDRNHNGSHDRVFGSSLASPVRTTHPGLQLGLGGRWWDDHKVVKKLNLSPSQQQRMDSIFEANRPTLVTLYSNFLHQQELLASIPPGDLQDEAKVFAAIDRVAQARSDLEKENVHMLLQVRQELAPEQLQRLDEQIAKLH